MKTVAMVPIKMNSVRLPDKNILCFDNGDPLCTYILRTLLKVNEINQIYVYCSDERIKDYLPQGVHFLKRSTCLDQDTTKIGTIKTDKRQTLLHICCLVILYGCTTGWLSIMQASSTVPAATVRYKIMSNLLPLFNAAAVSEFLLSSAGMPFSMEFPYTFLLYFLAKIEAQTPMKGFHTNNGKERLYP